MTPQIKKVKWAKVKIDDREYWQALITDGQVLAREAKKVKEKYGTDHLVADWEQKQLLSGQPEVILIANGWSGVLKVQPEFREKVSQAGIELRVVLTPKIVKEYDQLVKAGKKVNVLIHTTC